MPAPDIFAFKKSGLDGFLFAHVGTELNGSALTVQSMLARLGRDPWAEAARCASMPLPAVIDGLSASIAQMPLSPQCLADARATAETLSRLLPAPPRCAARQHPYGYTGMGDGGFPVGAAVSRPGAEPDLFFRHPGAGGGDGTSPPAPRRAGERGSLRRCGAGGGAWPFGDPPGHTRQGNHHQGRGGP